MTIDDAEHYTPEEREAIVSSYPEHEREARANGVPTMGSGRIFPVPESTITVEAFPIPAHWVRIGGLDFGYDHPTAGAQLAWDRDDDVIYVISAYKGRGSDIAAGGLSPTATHCAALKSWGDIPWSWPHDGLQHDKDSGKQLKEQYADQGLDMLEDKATHAPVGGGVEGSGGNSVEAGLQEMLDRMQVGKFKVFSHLLMFFEEFRLYHRKDGRVVKEYDDLISAVRYAYMMRRFARIPRDEQSNNWRQEGGGRKGGYRAAW